MGIINRSAHPVYVKRIEVEVWSLRDEIEHALRLRQKQCEDEGIEFHYDDIKEYYSRPSRLDSLLDAEEDPPEGEEEAENGNLDASGNPMDDDAQAMLAALGGDDQEESSEENTEEESDDAAAAALEALGDSEEGDASESSEEEDDEAQKIAAMMLEGQGAPSPSDETQNASPDEEAEPIKTASSYKRVAPSKEKRVKGFILLSDINMKFALVFSQYSFTPGQAIVIELQIPRKITLSADLFDSANLGMRSRIISPSRPNYRMQCVFTFNQPGERHILREFLTSIEPEIPPSPKVLAKSNDDDDDMDFDDLGL